MAAMTLPPNGLDGSAPRTDELTAEFKAAMRQLAAGVAIVSAAHAGRRSGLTATAVCSLTTDPPSLLVCVNRSSHTHGYIERSERFCVNILAHHHQEIAEVFAGASSLEGEHKFAFGQWTDGLDEPPRLLDALVVLDCDVMQKTEVGTHTVFFGRVRSAGTTASGSRPLVYADRRFLQIAD